jgi:hypothetical protein
MVVRDLAPISCDTLLLEVYALYLRAAEAGAVPDQGLPQGLGDVLGLYVAAYGVREHGPEGEEVLPGDEHDPDVVAVPGQPASVLAAV